MDAGRSGVVLIRSLETAKEVRKHNQEKTGREAREWTTGVFEAEPLATTE